MKLHLFLLLVLPVAAVCRQLPQPRDTSFTVYSAFQKARKTQPFITIADPHPKGIRTALNITYCRYGNRALQLDIYRPATTKGKLPAVLLIFGGGWRSGDRSQLAAMAKMLAANGFVAVAADYRLSAEAIYPAAVTDLKSCIRWVRAHAATYSIDPGKLAAWGFSAGGQLAALLGSTNGSALFNGTAPPHPAYSADLQAVVDADGILAFIHPESGEGDDSKSPSAATLWFGAPKSSGTAVWVQASALTHVSHSNPPILFINSSVARMHAGRDDFIRKLDSLHIYSEVHTFSDAPHPFPLFEPWFTPTLQYTVAFLTAVFKNQEKHP